MGIGNLPNPPTPGLPVASAWGNAVSVRTIQAYANKTQLDTVWNDAPEGANAVTTDTFRVYQRRGGIWALPLNAPQGLTVGPIQGGAMDTPADVTVNAGIWYSETPLGPYNLLVNRLFSVSWSMRWENITAGTTPSLIGIIGGDVAASQTGDDVPIEGGFGQQTLVYGFTLSGLTAAVRTSVTGYFHTKGVAGGNPNATVPVLIAHRYIGANNNTTGTFRISLRRLAIIDLGPWS